MVMIPTLGPICLHEHQSKSLIPILSSMPHLQGSIHVLVPQRLRALDEHPERQLPGWLSQDEGRGQEEAQRSLPGKGTSADARVWRSIFVILGLGCGACTWPCVDAATSPWVARH